MKSLADQSQARAACAFDVEAFIAHPSFAGEPPIQITVQLAVMPHYSLSAKSTNQFLASVAKRVQELVAEEVEALAGKVAELNR